MTETSSTPSGQACPNCATINRVGVLLCEKCGYSLAPNAAAPATRQFDRDAASTDDPHATNVPGVLKQTDKLTDAKTPADNTVSPPTEAPPTPPPAAAAPAGSAPASTEPASSVPAPAAPVPASAPPAGTPPAVPPTDKPASQTDALTPHEPPPLIVTEAQKQAVLSAGTDHFSESMVLKLEIEGYPTPLVITPKNEITLGRRDPATGTMPDIDLTAYSGYRLGVSRTHAIIRMKGDQLELLDLGSSNGTQINGSRLTPHHPQIIRDGDLITLGKMVIRSIFQLITPNPT